MSATAHIERLPRLSPSRIGLFQLPVVDMVTGKVTDRAVVRALAGKWLIGVSDFVRLGLESRSQLYRRIKSGELIAYSGNGAVKEFEGAAGADKTYIDLGQWQQIGKDGHREVVLQIKNPGPKK